MEQILEEKLNLRLLGNVQLTLGENNVDCLSIRAQAVLAYLAMEQKTVTRLTLASLIWPDISEARALANLRKVILEFRQQIPTFIVITRQSLAIATLPKLKFSVDAWEFEKRANLLHKSLHSAPPNKETLKHVINTYKGTFLDKFDLTKSSGFSIWQERTGERLAQTAVDCCECLIRCYQEEGDLTNAIRYSRRLLNIQPWREETHRSIMQLFVASGQRSAALKQYNICKEILSDEFGVSPCDETQELHRNLRNSDARFEPFADQTLRASTDESIYLPSQNSRFIVGPPVTEAHRFFGRSAEISFVAQTWESLPLSSMALVGARRSGKTSLLSHIQALLNPGDHVFRPGQRSDWLERISSGKAVSVDFQDPRMRSRSRLLRHLLRCIGRDSPEPCSLEQFMDIALEQSLQAPVFIFMDELSAALTSDELDQSFWWCMRSLTQASDGLLGFLIASHQTPMLEAAAADKASPFFNLFSTIEISSLSNIAARELLSQAQPPMTKQDVDWIITQSQCKPELLQAFAREYEMSVSANINAAQWRETAIKRVELMNDKVTPETN